MERRKNIREKLNKEVGDLPTSLFLLIFSYIVNLAQNQLYILNRIQMTFVNKNLLGKELELKDIL